MIKSIESTLKSTHRIMVCFADPTIFKHDDVHRIQTELEQPIEDLVIFFESQECIDYLNQVHEKQIVLIVGENNGEQIVRNVLSLSKLQSIYILCSNPSHRPPWMSICRSIQCYLVDLPSLCDRIQMETIEEHHNIAFDILSPSSSENESKNKQEATFMYGQLLKHILTRMSYTEENMEKMVELFKEKSSNSKASQEFREHYAPDKALLYYTTEIFFFSTLNTALRTCDLDVIYTMGIFIKDLHKQIVQLHKPLGENEMLHLYRGQVIRTKDFERIQKNTGGLMSINQFLSTSTTRDVAEDFALGAPDGDTGVVFHMTIDQSMSRTNSYANIKDYSKFPDEDEYLFTIGSVFRIESVELDAKKIWCVYLSLTNDHDVQLTTLTDYYLKFLKSPNLLSLGFVMFTMGQYEKVAEICETAVKATNNILDLHLSYFHWSCACFQMGHKRQALKIIEQALSYGEQLPMLPQLGSFRLLMKGLYSFIQGEYDHALSLFQQCIDSERQNPHTQCHIETLSGCHQMIGYINQCKGNFAGALPHYSTAYQTMNGHLPSLHPLMTSYLQESSLCHTAIGEKDQALSLIKEASHIGERALLTEDLLAVKSSLIQGIVERDLGYNQDVHHSDTDQSELSKNPIRLFQQATRYVLQKRYDEALATIDELLRLQEQTNSFLDSDMVDVYSVQGNSLLNKRDFKKALESFRQAEHIATPIQAQVGHKMSTIRLWIAVCYAEQNNDNQAMYIVEEYRQMLSNETELNSNRSNQEALQWLIHSFARRAMDDQTRGQYQEAVHKLERCLQVQRMIVPGGHLDQGETYRAIGDCFRMMSNWSYALTNYRKALVIYEKFVLSNDPAILQIWLLIGMTQAVSGQYDEALAAFMKRQQLLLTVDSPNYSELADNYQQIATVFFNQGNLFDAVTNYQQSLDIYAKYSLPANFKTAGMWMTLGYIYASQKEDDDAVIALNTALEILISTSAPMVQDVANIHEKLGVLHRRAERYPEALLSFQNCLQNQRSCLPADHLDLAETLSSIGEMNAELKRFSDAAICYEYASQIQIKYLPVTTSKMITTMKNAASCYFRLLDWEKFFSLQEDILEFQLNSLPAGHLDIAQTYRQMGGVCNFIGNVEEALEHYLKCLDIQMNSLSSDHPLLLETRAEIDEISNVLNYRHK